MQDKRYSVVDIFEKKLLSLFQLFLLLSVRCSYQEFRSLKSKPYNIPQMSTIFRLMAILEYYCSYYLNLLRIGKYSKFHFLNVFCLEKIFSKNKILSDHQFTIFQYIQCVRFRFDSHLLVTYVTSSKAGVIVKYKNQDLSLVLPKLSSSEYALNIPMRSAPRSMNKILPAPQNFPSVPLQVYPPKIRFISSFSTHMYQF